MLNKRHEFEFLCPDDDVSVLQNILEFSEMLLAWIFAVHCEGGSGFTYEDSGNLVFDSIAALKKMPFKMFM